MSDEDLEHPWCPECRRGTHRCVNCEQPTVHGDLQCAACIAAGVEVPVWARPKTDR